MPTRSQTAAVLFCFSLSVASTAHSQSCSDRLRQAANHQESHVVSAKLLQIPPKAWHHFKEARAAIERNQPEIAEREVAKALVVAPRFAEVYLLRATQQLHAGQYQAALETIAAARGIDPDLPWSGVLAAGAHNGLHHYNDAIAELERTRGGEADSWQLDYEQARAETGLRDSAAALHWSELAVASAPVGCTEARLVRANALQLAGRHSEVVTELENYLAEDRQGTHHAEVLRALDRARQRSLAADRGLLAMKDPSGVVPGQNR